MEISVHSFGAKLRIKDGMYRVMVPDLSGLNQHQEELFPAHEVRTFLLSQGTSVSSDAMIFAMENDTDVIFIDPLGQPVGRMLPTRPSSTLNIWQNQLAISQTAQALQIAKYWVIQKMRHQLRFFDKLRPYRSGEKLQILARGEKSIKEGIISLHNLVIRPDDLSASAASLRGIEGIHQKKYWETLSQLLPTEYQFNGRSRQPATDLFNAFLNYAYGILYRHVESALIKAGVHPYIGFLHVDGYQRKSMVFDFIEPYRVWADHLMFKLFVAKRPQTLHVIMQTDGGFWLERDGKRLILDAFAERVAEKTYPHRDGTYQSLPRLMFLEAQRLASAIQSPFGLIPAFSEN